ncbi:hypothetical protein M9458_019235, partial [Cirrhinus mrigala]
DDILSALVLWFSHILLLLDWIPWYRCGQGFHLISWFHNGTRTMRLVVYAGVTAWDLAVVLEDSILFQ